MKEKLAIFLDTENLLSWINSEMPEQLLKDLSSFGQVIVRRAYGKWTSPHLIPHQGNLNRLGFELIHTYHPVSGKNSSDIQMTVEIMEYAWRVEEISWFVLATGDSDFSPLFRRLREMGKEVIGIGPRSALSESVKSSCSRFIYTDMPKIEDKDTLQSELDDAVELIETALKTFDGPANCSALKNKIINMDSAFDEKSLGYGSFTELLKTVNTVELRHDKSKSAWFASLKKNNNQKAHDHNKSGSNNASSQRNEISQEDVYRQILRKKKWVGVSKDKLQKIFQVAQNCPPTLRAELVDKIIEKVQGSISSTEIRKALSIIYKAKLVDVSSSDNDVIWKIKTSNIEVAFELIDYALLARLLNGLTEQDIKLELKYLPALLFGQYKSKTLQNMINEVSADLKTKEVD